VGACLAPIWIGSSQGSLASVQWRQRERSEYRRVGMCRRRGNDLNTGVWACAGGARTCAARWPTGGATGRRAAGALAAGTRGRGRESPGRAALQRVQRRDLRARQVSLLRREVLRDSLASPAPSTSVAGAVRRLRLPDGLHALPLQARGKRLAHFCGVHFKTARKLDPKRMAMWWIALLVQAAAAFQLPAVCLRAPVVGPIRATLAGRLKASAPISSVDR